MLLAADKDRLALHAKLFRGFSDPSRLGILEALVKEPLSVSEIVEATGLSQSNTSNHLACLRDCGLVISEQSGRSVTYRLSDDRVATLLKLAEDLVADVARGVYECTRYNVPSSAESTGESQL
ncbi:MAG: transcriptional regulator [Chloroflexi bacterium]|nr:MAG: transcriptional regulator [Chloroflexota bacterium]HMN12337.1 metalloregulator ArsR/SmtB family transcription factor [Bellilinea sp.]